jgi:DNA-binding NarL/FixJ family response regulator
MKILIIDEHPLIHAGCKLLLSRFEKIKIYEARNGHSAFHIFLKHKPDITVLEILLPDMSGLDLIKKLKKVDYKAKIIVLSSHESSAFILKANELGASAYVVKKDEPRILIEAIHKVLSGKVVVNSKGGNSSSAKQKLNKDLKWMNLNEREREILTT